jgi:hypothetical protein
MAHDDQFTATGPPFTGSGVPRTGFSTNDARFVHGANVQGTRTGIFGQSERAATSRESDVDGVGAYGVGDNFGVFGKTNPSPGRPGLAGIYGQHNRGGIGTVGIAMRGGTAVMGLNVGSIGNPLATIGSPPDPADGAGTGVFGTSGTGDGVRGTSDSGDGVVGRSSTGRGGQFASGGLDELVPQVGLEPQRMPVPGTVPARPEMYGPGVAATLPAAGRGGDLLATQDDAGDCTLWFCRRGQQGDQPAQWAQVLLGLKAPLPPGVAEIAWPGRLVTSTGVGAAGQDPASILGPPDGTTDTLTGSGQSGTYGDFTAQRYPDIAQLLGPGHITHGDTPSPADLARADVIAFEDNSHGPDSGGGWESCDFRFSDGTSTVTVRWNGVAGAARDPHVVANGTVAGPTYQTYFGISPAAIAGGFSYLLFSLPELHTHDPSFTAAVTSTTLSGAGEGSPDVDAIGVITRPG